MSGGAPATSREGGPEAPRQLEAAEQLARSFKGTLAAVRRLRGRETRHPGELSDAQYGLLFGLREHPELSSKELALAADLSAATATEMLDGLAAAGLVRRERSERDRRVVLISLTDRGREVVEGRRARLEPMWREALSQYTDDELLRAADVLDSLHALFERMSETA